MTVDHECEVEEDPEKEPKRRSAFFLSSGDILDWMTDLVEMGLERTYIRDKIAKPIARKMMNWGMRWSLFPLHFGIMCCALEMASSGASRYDTTRFGIIYRSSPRQCDVLLLTGPISHKLKPSILRLWEQMPEPKWVVAMGECAISGGPYYDSYSVIPGTDNFLPVDIYIPGCPARPEALIDGFLKLQDKIFESRDKDIWRVRSGEKDKFDIERRERVKKVLEERAIELGLKPRPVEDGDKEPGKKPGKKK